MKTATHVYTTTAPRELVFKAWAEEERVKEWWGPGEFINPVCKVDARVGGLTDIHMRAPGGTVYPMKATFTEIAHNERIVFTRGRSMRKGSCSSSLDRPAKGFFASV